MQPHRHSALLGQHHQSLTAPPQPPRGLVPEGLRNGPAVQVCDIRKEPGRLTETGAREELSDYLIFRFELADRDKIYNDDGETVKPTWAKVVRTEAKGISKAEAARQIKDLNDHTLPLGTKKASLTETQQRQLEKVLEELEFRDVDDRFHYVLVQIDHKLQKKVTGTSSSRDRFRSPSRSMRSDRRSDYSRKRGNKYRKYGDARGRSETIVYADSRGRRRSVVKEKRGKTVRETVSLTAYYKRCPKAEVDSVALLLQRDALLARQLQPPNPHQTYAPQQLHQENNFGVQHQQYQPQPNHNMGTTPGMPVNMNGNMNMSVPPPPIGGNAMRSSYPNQLPRPPIGNDAMRLNQPNQMPPNHVPRPSAGTSMPRPPPPPVRVLPNQVPNRAPHNPSFPPQRGNNNRGRSTSSSSSGSDFDSSSDNDAASVLTPNSSRSSNSYSFNPPTHTKERRGSRGSKYIEDPRHFGVPPKRLAPHKARQHQEHRISDEFINLGPKGSTAPLIHSMARRNSHSPGPLVPRHDGFPNSRHTVQSRQNLHSPAPFLPRHSVPSIPSTVPSRRDSPTTPTRLTPPYPLDLHEIEAKAYLVGRADGRADIHERFDVLNARPPSPPHRQMHQAQRLITQQSSSPLHPPLFRRATLPAAVPHTTDDLRVLLDEDRRASPLLVSRGVRPKVLNRRPSIHHIQSDYPRHGYDSLDRRQRSLERERDMLDSLDRFRLQDDMVRRREDDRYHDDVALERRLRELDLEDESRFGAEKAVRGRLRRGRDEDVTYGGGDYDDERERSPFVSVRPSIARRATVGYGYRR